MNVKIKVAVGLLGAVGSTYAISGVASADEISTLGDAKTYTVSRWVDGDTVIVDRLGRVRLIGIDAADKKDACHTAWRRAKDFAESAAPAGTTVTLVNPSSVDDTDIYDRALRYVYTTSDIGEALIRFDLADARYDSRDGYSWHPREDLYRSLDVPGSVNDQKNPACLLPVIAAANVGENDSHDYPEPDPHHSQQRRYIDFLEQRHAQGVAEREEAKREARAEQQRIEDACEVRPILHPAGRAAYNYFKKHSGMTVYEFYCKNDGRAFEKARAAYRDGDINLAGDRPAPKPAPRPAPKPRPASKPSSGSGSSSGGSYSGYTGPRCYAPGGKTWTPC